MVLTAEDVAGAVCTKETAVIELKWFYEILISNASMQPPDISVLCG